MWENVGVFAAAVTAAVLVGVLIASLIRSTRLSHTEGQLRRVAKGAPTNELAQVSHRRVVAALMAHLRVPASRRWALPAAAALLAIVVGIGSVPVASYLSETSDRSVTGWMLGHLVWVALFVVACVVVVVAAQRTLSARHQRAREEVLLFHGHESSSSSGFFAAPVDPDDRPSSARVPWVAMVTLGVVGVVTTWAFGVGLDLFRQPLSAADREWLAPWLGSVPIVALVLVTLGWWGNARDADKRAAELDGTLTEFAEVSARALHRTHRHEPSAQQSAVDESAVASSQVPASPEASSSAPSVTPTSAAPVAKPAVTPAEVAETAVPQTSVAPTPVAPTPVTQTPVTQTVASHPTATQPPIAQSPVPQQVVDQSPPSPVSEPGHTIWSPPSEAALHVKDEVAASVARAFSAPTVQGPVHTQSAPEPGPRSTSSTTIDSIEYRATSVQFTARQVHSTSAGASPMAASAVPASTMASSAEPTSSRPPVSERGPAALPAPPRPAVTSSPFSPRTASTPSRDDEPTSIRPVARPVADRVSPEGLAAQWQRPVQPRHSTVAESPRTAPAAPSVATADESAARPRRAIVD